MSMVVMPMGEIRVPEHCLGLIPDSAPGCQTILGPSLRPSASSAALCVNGLFQRRAAENAEERREKLSAGDERPRLNNINLPLHVSPFDVLIAAAEDAFDSSRGTY
jgi:hypothetical protein